MTKQRDKRVLFVAEGGDSTRGYFRGELPARGLIVNGWNSRSASILYEQESGRFNGYRVGDTTEAIAPRIIVSHVLMTPKGTPENYELTWKSQRDIIEQAKRNGQIWLHDLDDDIWNVPEWNPGYNNPNGIAGGKLKEWVDDVNAGEGLIVSTDSIRESARGNGIKVPIWVCRNGIEGTRNADRDEHKTFRIAYFGALEFRKPDFLELAPAIAEWRKGIHYGQYFFEFWHYGANFESESIRDIVDWFPIPVVERPWVKVRELVNAIRNVDLVLIPSVDCKFNHGRSNVLGLACMAAGVPCIASPTDEYDKLAHWATGVDTVPSEEFLNSVISWYHYETLRKEYQERGPELALQYAPREIAKPYIKVFEECLT